MATIRDTIMPVLEQGRSLTGPAFAGLRRARVAIVQREWTEHRLGAGECIEVSRLTLPPWYSVKEVTDREIAGSGGRYKTGMIKVVVTPRVGSVGYSQEEIAPVIQHKGFEVFYELTGEISGEYARVSVEVKPFRFTLILEAMGY